MLTKDDSYLYKVSVRDIISLLEEWYESGVIMKQSSIKDLERYISGRYYRTGAISMSYDEPINRQSPLNSKYQHWLQGATSYLSYEIIPKSYRTMFLNSKELNDLNDATDTEIKTAYDKSLDSLRTIIEMLKTYQSKSIKTVSLLKLGSTLYLHIEPGNRNIPLHEFNPGSPLEKEFEYIYSHQGRVIVSGELDITGQGASTKRSLSEDLRAMKIDGNLKRLFFPQSSANSILLNNQIELSDDQLNDLINGLKSDIKLQYKHSTTVSFRFEISDNGLRHSDILPNILSGQMSDAIKTRRKEDALELAYLIYDIFKEETESDDKIESGQNNA